MDKKSIKHVIIDGIEYKRCKQCGELKLINEFDKDKKGKDGTRNICKVCRLKNAKTPKGIKAKAKETYQNYDWLYNQYILENKTLIEISREIGIKNETIKNWLVKLNIPLKTLSESRMRMIETNEEYSKLLHNVYEERFNGTSGFKGCHWSEEDKIRIGKDRTNFFSIQENRDNQSKILKETYSSQNVRDEVSFSLKEKYATGEIKSWNTGLTSKEDNRILAGENHPMFNNWSSLDKYSAVFNQELKYKIIKRDEYKCQECGISNYQSKKKYKRSLCIHHINYDKKDCNEENLIALCSSCHAKTNFNREEWKQYFKNKINEKYKED